VVAITCTLPICATDVGKGVEKLGWKYDEIEFDTSKGPQAYVAAWEQALQRKPNYIITVGIFPPTLITTQLAQAKSEGIGVVGVVGESNNPAFKSCVNCGYYLGQLGERLADIAISRGATASSTVSLGDPTNIGTGQGEAGINSEYTRLHAGGKPPLLALSLEHAPPQNNTAVVNYIQAHSGINTVINTLSDLTVGLPDALKQAGLSGKVTYYVSAPQVADIADVKNGEEGPALAIMNNAAWWHGLDQVVQLAAGKPVDPNGGGWLAVMTKENADAMIAAGGSTTPEPPHYEQEYLSSWGVG
jgi:ABC-type sugar transport system substrate-binding protein